MAKGDGQEPTIIKNESLAYGYKYSSLADIASAGVKIPPMRLRVIDGSDYIEYLDDKGEWQLGAKVVVPDMKGCNQAQAYGSAVTYARRYTVQLAKSLACDDDAKVEKQPPDDQKAFQKPAPKIDFKRVNEIKQKVKGISSTEELENYWRELKLNASYKKIVTPYFQSRKKEIVPEEPDYAE